jgi:hypothetical protein
MMLASAVCCWALGQEMGGGRKQIDGFCVNASSKLPAEVGSSLQGTRRAAGTLAGFGCPAVGGNAGSAANGVACRPLGQRPGPAGTWKFSGIRPLRSRPPRHSFNINYRQRFRLSDNPVDGRLSGLARAPDCDNEQLQPGRPSLAVERPGRRAPLDQTMLPVAAGCCPLFQSLLFVLAISSATTTTAAWRT